MPDTRKPFSIMYGSSTNFTNLPVRDGTLFMVTQPTSSGQDPYVMGYVDLGSTRYAIGAPVPSEVATAINLKYPLTFRYNGNNLAAAQDVSYSGGNSPTLIEDKWVITDSENGTSTGASDISDGSVYINHVVAVTRGSNATNTTLVGGINIVGGADTTVTYDVSEKQLIIATDVPTALPNPNAITFSNGAGTTISYTGAEVGRVITYSSVGAAAANTEITNASFGNDNKTLTLTKASGNITVELPATIAADISGNAATATTAQKTQAAITFTSTPTANTAASGTSFNGQTAREISYTTIGAAPSTGIQLSAIDWTSGTIPSSAIPESAIEKLYIAPAASTGQTNAQAAAAFLNNHDEITEGDVIQVGDNGELFFVYDNSGTLEVKSFSAGTAAQATKVSHTLTFVDGQGTAGVAAGQSWDGSADKTIGYATVGAAGKDTEITNASFGNDNKTLTLTKAAGNITVTLPATIAADISGNAATATIADGTTGALSFSVDGSTPVSFNGSQNRSISYTTNSALTYQSLIGTLNLFGTSYSIYGGMFWDTFDA